MRFFYLVLPVFFLVGCGGGGSGTANTPQEPPLPAGTEAMELGQIYEVAPGDSVVRVSDDAQIKVTHVAEEANSTIELALGKANIVRAQ